jgi:uncharacterized protein (TIRG00374 family)
MNIRLVQIVVGLACTLFFMALALYRVPLGAVGATIASANPMWIGAAMSVYAVNLSLRAWRWQIILSPVAAIRYSTVARALLIGYGLNSIMPARFGEFFRAEFLKIDMGLSRVSALSSIVVERLFDGLTVVGCLAFGLLLASGENAAALLDVLLIASALFGVILLGALCLAGPTMSGVFVRYPRLSEQLMLIRQAFQILRTRQILVVAALTLIIYLPDALALWFIVKAVGLQLDFAVTLVLLGAVSLSSLLPSGPAYLGTLQFAYALAIEFAGAPPAVGVAAATLAQLCILLPTALAGVAVLVHRSRGVLSSVLAKREPKLTPVGP